MIHPPARRLVALTVLAAATGCDRSSPEESGGPELVVEWTGGDTGRMAAPARAEWCDTLRLLEIRGIHGDTGLALAVYPGDSVRADSYPVVTPDRADSLRPSAAVALRWFAETAIRGFQGRQGAVVLERADDRLTGRFTAAARSINEGTQLDLRGSFRDIPIEPASSGCTAPPPTEPGDSG